MKLILIPDDWTDAQIKACEAHLISGADVVPWFDVTIADYDPQRVQSDVVDVIDAALARGEPCVMVSEGFYDDGRKRPKVISTTRGVEDRAKFRRVDGVHEDENEKTVWVEYWDGDELVHRSAHVHIKKGPSLAALTGNF